MRPLAFEGSYALVFWGVYVWTFWPEVAIARRAQRTQGPSDSRSLDVILIGKSVAYFSAFALAWVPALQFPLAYRVAAFFIGIATIITGSLLRRHCWRMLGSSFTGDVRARPDQQVVNRGAYRLLRHPSYTGGLLVSTGIGIALGSWGSATLLAVMTIGVYMYRMAVEERTLLAVIGEPYRQFMNTRKRLIPFVY